MKDILKRQRIFFISLIGIVVVSLALVSTFAYQTLGVYVKDGSSDEFKIKAGVLDVNFTTNRRINLSNMSLLNEYKSSDYTELVIDNSNSTEDVVYNIKLVDLDFSKELISKDFRYTIVKVTDDNENIISDGNFTDLDYGEYVFLNNYGNYIYIKQGETQKIRIYLWLKETEDDQNYLANTYFKGKIEVSSYFAKDTNDKVITDFKIYGNSKIDENDTKTISFLGKIVDDINDKNYGKYKIDLILNSKNLFKTEEIFERISDSWVYQNIYLPKGEYIINYISDEFDDIMVKDINDNIVINEQLYTEPFIIENDGYYKVFIGDKENNYKFNSNVTPSIYQAQLSKTEDNIGVYEPNDNPINYSVYLNEPLRCINDKCDYIDLVNNKIVRVVKELVLNGSESWNLNSNDYDIYSLNTNISTSNAISNYFNYSNDINVGNFNIANGNINIVYSNKNESNIDSFKEWLNNNNLKIYYILTNEEYNIISSMNIRTFNNNVIVTDGNISSSKIDINYNK